MAVFDRIEMDVIEMTRKIAFVEHRMLPKSPLPNPVFAFRGAAGGDPFPSRQTSSKGALDNYRLV